jgi:hypothetical protein
MTYEFGKSDPSLRPQRRLRVMREPETVSEPDWQKPVEGVVREQSNIPSSDNKKPVHEIWPTIPHPSVAPNDVRRRSTAVRPAVAEWLKENLSCQAEDTRELFDRKTEVEAAQQACADCHERLKCMAAAVELVRNPEVSDTSGLLEQNVAGGVTLDYLRDKFEQ